MSDEQFELEEILFWENDPPENEDEEPVENTESENSSDDEDDSMAPTEERGPKPGDPVIKRGP